MNRSKLLAKAKNVTKAIHKANNEVSLVWYGDIFGIKRCPLFATPYYPANAAPALIRKYMEDSHD